MATYYVDIAIGSDSNSGLGQTAGTALRTIQAALNKSLVAGDIVEVKPTGTYTQALTMSKSGSAGNPIIIRGFGWPSATRPVIDGTGTAAVPMLNIQSPASINPISYITVAGLEIKNSQNAGIKWTNGNNIILKNNYLHDNTKDGILTSGSFQCTVDGNWIVHNGYNGQSGTHGMYFEGQQFKIINNVSIANSLYGMQCAGYNNIDHTYFASASYAYFKHNLIANNVFAYNGSISGGGMNLWGATQNDPNPGSCDDNDVENNIFYENNPNASNGIPNGIYILNPGTQAVGNRIKNNLAYSTSPRITFFLLATSNSIYSMFNNLPASASGNGPDPRFVSAPSTYTGNYDFHLQATSPAATLGLNLYSSPLFTTDFANSSRLSTGAWTAGAYILNGTIPDTTAPATPTGLQVI